MNAYYTGRVGNLEIDFNADYYQSGYLQEDITGEESEEQEDRDVHAASDVANNLAATKLGVILSCVERKIFSRRRMDLYPSQRQLSEC